jgi:hypothetical protein
MVRGSNSPWRQACSACPERICKLQLHTQASKADLKAESIAFGLLQDVQWVEEQVKVLGTLLPDLIAKLPQMKASLLLALVKDTQVQPCHICLLEIVELPNLHTCTSVVSSCKSWPESGQSEVEADPDTTKVDGR